MDSIKRRTKPKQKVDDFLNPVDESDFRSTNTGNKVEISRGDRVALLGPNDFAEYGWVRWLGTLSKDRLGLMAGVEFDNPVGNDNHLVGGIALFEARENHASIVPASMLIPVDDLLEYEVTSHNFNPTKNFDRDDTLGRNMQELSPFHKMAYEQLAKGTGPLNPMGDSTTYTGKIRASGNGHFKKSSSEFEKENWGLLPSATYGAQKHQPELKLLKMSGATNPPRTTMADELRSYPSNQQAFKTIGRIAGPLASNNMTSKCTTNFTNESVSSQRIPSNLDFKSSGNGTFGSRDKEQSLRDRGRCPDSDRLYSSQRRNSSPIENTTNSPFYHLSHNGINQLELISEAEGLQFPTSTLDEDVGIGSLVEILFAEPDCPDDLKAVFGVIRWIGNIPNVSAQSYKDATGKSYMVGKIAGIEVEEVEEGLSDGIFQGERYFECSEAKGIFVPLKACVKDSRFAEDISHMSATQTTPSKTNSGHQTFGSTDCQPIVGCVPPVTSASVMSMFGRNKGIQGHQNSCYLDATLFSMFAFTSVFDGLLFRPPSSTDIREYSDVQSVLREEIVNPLRRNMYVRADRIMKLRTMLDHLSSVRGLTTEEKDPEEFLQSLLAQLLQAEPLLQLSSGQEAYHYQLFVDKDDRISLPSVQNLFDQSFLTSDIKLKTIPSCLIIQMPRFGKDYKMYPRILPSMVLDVTDVIEDSPRQCIICGNLAEFECRECYSLCAPGLESIAFCAECMDKTHSHKKRGCHTLTKPLKVPPEFQMLAAHCGSIPRAYMELFAVVCIETSHYVTFTRCGSGAESTWCFFDSMADRKGEQNGYNIPTVVECSDLMQWVGEEDSQMLHRVTDNKALPDLPRRLLCDAYMCFYQSPKVMMYR